MSKQVAEEKLTDLEEWVIKWLSQRDPQYRTVLEMRRDYLKLPVPGE